MKALDLYEGPRGRPTISVSFNETNGFALPGLTARQHNRKYLTKPFSRLRD